MILQLFSTNQSEKNSPISLMIKAEIPWVRQVGIPVKKGTRIKGTATGLWKISGNVKKSKWRGPDGDPDTQPGKINYAELHYRINNNEPRPAGKKFNFEVPENGILKFWCKCNTSDVWNNMGRLKVTLTKLSSTVPNVSPHKTHLEKYKKLGYKTEAQWDKYHKIVHDSTKNMKAAKRNKRYKVFGWQPYYKGTAYKSYDFSILWGISYIDYHVEPHTGSYKSIHNWKTTKIVDYAKKAGCKVFLTACNFGHSANTVFLENEKSQDNFIKTILPLLDYRKADGLNIDFEEIPGKLRKKFTDFLIKLSTELKRKNYELILALPSIDFEKVFEIKKIKDHIDLFVIMGYDYYYSGSQDAGPVSPLQSGRKWEKYNLETSVDQYLISGVPASRLLLAIAYYGREWHTATSTFPSKNTGYILTNSYRAIKNYGHLENSKLDPLSLTKYLIVKDNKKGYRQLWFDDKESLGGKYDWIKKKKIAGVAIWALGYDHGYTELWDLLRTKFGKKD